MSDTRNGRAPRHSIAESRRELRRLAARHSRLLERMVDLEIEISDAIQRARARRMLVDDIVLTLGVGRMTMYRIRDRGEEEKKRRRRKRTHA